MSLNNKAEAIIHSIEQADTSKITFSKSADLFARGQFLKELPHVLLLIFGEELNSVISNLNGEDYFHKPSI